MDLFLLKYREIQDNTCHLGRDGGRGERGWIYLGLAKRGFSSSSSSSSEDGKVVEGDKGGEKGGLDGSLDCFKDR